MKEFNEKDLLLLAYLENDLSEADKAKVEAMLAEDAALMHEYTQLTKTILPAETITYASKNALKKDVQPKRKTLVYMVWSGAVAAVLAVIVLFSQQAVTNTKGVEVANNSLPKNEVQGNTATNKDETITATQEALIAKADVAAPSSTKKIKKYTGEVVTKQHTPTIENTTGIELFEKGNYTTKTLTKKEVAIATTDIPESTVELNYDLQPQLLYINTETAESWWAKQTNKINNTLTTWASYLQKPKVEIDKKEPVDGRIYWAITLETDKYEWEGRLYTHR